MNKADRLYLNSVQALGCMACRKLGHLDTPAVIHHVRMGQGMGQRASNREVIPLCPWHHNMGGHGEAIHAGQKTWEKRFGTEEELLKQVTELLTLADVG